jgi:hypothetical protein
MFIGVYAFIKKHQRRHLGDSQGPEVILSPGFRLLPE